MGALSYFLEREGLMTAGISLVRENTASMQPPRALWVSFPLGRPLGVPDDASFQTDVIRAALALLDKAEGPVLEDYPIDAPDVAAENAAACPVSFASATESDGSWQSRLSSELKALQPWYELSRRRRDGRTLVGISERSPEENILEMGRILDEGASPPDVTWLKRASEDLKAFYSEAMTAQPGAYDANAIQEQFWQDTCLGAAILMFYHQYQSSDDNRQKLIARMLAPREAVGTATGPQGGLEK